MNLQTIYIGRFGGLKNFTLDLSGGINIIEGNNESGKTTVCNFIRFIFYGFKDKRERTLYISWNTDSAGGYITVNHSGSTYRIERECTAGGIDTVRIIDTAMNSTVFTDQTPSDVFFGVPSDVYDRTVYIKQADNGHIDDKGIGEAIENLLYSADETVNTDKALKRLDDARIMLLHKNEKGGAIYDLESEAELLETRLFKAIEHNHDVIIRDNYFMTLKQKLSDNNERQKELSDIIKHYEQVTLARKYNDFRQILDNIDSAENEITQLQSSYKNGTDFLPDYKYIEHVKTCEDEIALYSESADELADKLDNTSDLTPEQTEFNDTLARYGDLASLNDKLDNYLLQRRMMVIIGSVCGILFTLAAVAAFWMILNIGISGAFMFIAALALLVVTIVCFINSSRQKIMCELIYEDFNVKNDAQLDTYIEKMLGELSNNTEHSEHFLMMQKNYDNLILQRNAKTDELGKYLKMWNKPDADTAVTDAEKYLFALRDKEHELDKLMNLYNSIAPAFDEIEFDEAELLKIEPDDVSDIDIKALRREYDFIYQANEALKLKIHETEKQLIALRAENEPPSAISDNLTIVTDKAMELRQAHDAYRLAYDKLAEAITNIKQTAAPKLTAYASELIDKFTAGKYDTLGVSHDLKMDFTAGNMTRSSVYMSAGTSDIAYLSLRFALIRLLCGDSEPPVLMDETFARIDDTRLTNILNLLGETDTQILLFTSQKRDAELMRNTFNHIILGG